MQTDQVRSAVIMDTPLLGQQLNKVVVAGNIMQQQQQARFPYMPPQHMNDQCHYMQQQQHQQHISNNMVCYRKKHDLMLSPRYHDNQHYFNNNILPYADPNMLSPKFNKSTVPVYPHQPQQHFYRHPQQQQQLSPMMQHNMQMYHESIQQNPNYFVSDTQQRCYRPAYPLTNSTQLDGDRYGDRVPSKHDVDHYPYHKQYHYPVMPTHPHDLHHKSGQPYMSPQHHVDDASRMLMKQSFYMHHSPCNVKCCNNPPQAPPYSDIHTPPKSQHFSHIEHRTHNYFHSLHHHHHHLHQPPSLAQMPPFNKEFVSPKKNTCNNTSNMPANDSDSMHSSSSFSSFKSKAKSEISDTKGANFHQPQQATPPSKHSSPQAKLETKQDLPPTPITATIPNKATPENVYSVSSCFNNNRTITHTSSNNIQPLSDPSLHTSQSAIYMTSKIHTTTTTATTIKLNSTRCNTNNNSSLNNNKTTLTATISNTGHTTSATITTPSNVSFKASESTPVSTTTAKGPSKPRKVRRKKSEMMALVSEKAPPNQRKVPVPFQWKRSIETGVVVYYRLVVLVQVLDPLSRF